MLILHGAFYGWISHRELSGSGLRHPQVYFLHYSKKLISAELLVPFPRRTQTLMQFEEDNMICASPANAHFLHQTSGAHWKTLQQPWTSLGSSVSADKGFVFERLLWELRHEDRWTQLIH
ncbi:unnamed protein product [Arctogadus glacialis]